MPVPLLLPDLPGDVDRLEAPPDTLVHAAPAGRRPFLVASPMVVVHGDELRGVDQVQSSGRILLRDVRTEAGPCSNVLAGPRSVRRELSGPGGTVLETVLAADRRAGVVFQWASPSAGALALDIRWRVPGRILAQRSAGPVLRVRPAGAPDRLFAVRPGPRRWELESGPDGLEVRVRVRAEEGPVTLLAGEAGPDDDGAGLLRVLARASVLERRSERFLDEVRSTLLSAATGVAEIDEGLAWAVARTASASPARGARTHLVGGSGAPPHGPLDRFWMLVGALASGDPGRARRWLPASPRGPADALAMGWWVRWTGDGGLVREHGGTLLDVLAGEDEAGDGSPPAASADHRQTPAESSSPLLHAARAAVAEGLEASGDEAGAGRLRAMDAGGSAPPPPDPPPPPAAGVSLPVVGRPPSEPGSLPSEAGGAPPGPSDEQVLRAVLGGGPPGSIAAPQPGLVGVPRALRAWALYATGRPDDGYALLREHLAEGVRPPAGMWAPGTRHPGPAQAHDPVAAALVPAVVLHGLLGARAEAAWGRLRLAPTLPGGWARFEVCGIRVGDARISLRYARREGTHTFRLAQTAGRVPVQLIFEPAVAGRIESVLVDGRASDVEPEREEDRSRIHLQLPLDSERMVSLVGSQS